jgi:hypothetical protein
MRALGPGGLDIDWVTGGLAIGGALPAGAGPRLARRHAIRGIVDVRSESCDDEVALARAGIELLHLPTPDLGAIEDAAIARGVAWVREALAREQRVLVHCQHGIGRSVMLALCVLVSEHIAPLDALSLIKEAREVASPSPDQLSAFMGFAEKVRASTGARWLVPSFAALARIAYRHLPGGGGT